MAEPAATWTPLASLTPWEQNPRDNTEAIAEVAKSIRRFGFGAPIVANSRDSTIIAGHTRLEAAKRLGLEEVPVRWMDLDPVDAKALALADNRVGEIATWDDAMLAQVLADLAAVDESVLADTGFSNEELSELMADVDGVEDVEDPGPGEPPAEPVSQVGEIYALGPHRLVCGDSTEMATLDLLMDGEAVNGVWTDPPYGVAYVGGYHSLPPQDRIKAGGLTVANDKLDHSGLSKMLGLVFENTLAHCHKGAPWYVATTPAHPFRAFADVLHRLGIWRHTMVWLKNSLVMGLADYHYRFELVLYGWAPGGAHPWIGGRAQDNVLEVDRPKRSKEHPTMKPVELIERCLVNHFKGEAVILDPFGGSGSTLIACARLGLQARLVELSPAYCDVIRRRWTRWAVEAGQDPGSGALDG